MQLFSKTSTLTWFAVVYPVIVIFGYTGTLLGGFDLLQPEVRTTAVVSLLVLAYPAFRIAGLIARYQRRQAGESDDSVERRRAGRLPPSPNSIEARMEARRRRVEKAREEGKL